MTADPSTVETHASPPPPEERGAPPSVLEKVLATTEPPPAAVDAAHSTSMSTTTPLTDLFESAGVLGLGASVALLWVDGLAAFGAVGGAVAVLCVASWLRVRKARTNERQLTAPRFQFSEGQLAAACASNSGLPAEAVAVLKRVSPAVELSQWQLTTLLAANMDEGRAAEVLPLVVRFATVRQF